MSYGFSKSPAASTMLGGRAGTGVFGASNGAAGSFGGPSAAATARPAYGASTPGGAAGSAADVHEELHNLKRMIDRERATREEAVVRLRAEVSEVRRTVEVLTAENARLRASTAAAVAAASYPPAAGGVDAHMMGGTRTPTRSVRSDSVAAPHSAPGTILNRLERLESWQFQVIPQLESVNERARTIVEERMRQLASTDLTRISTDLAHQRAATAAAQSAAEGAQRDATAALNGVSRATPAETTAMLANAVEQLTRDVTGLRQARAATEEELQKLNRGAKEGRADLEAAEGRLRQRADALEAKAGALEHSLEAAERRLRTDGEARDARLARAEAAITDARAAAAADNQATRGAVIERIAATDEALTRLDRKASDLEGAAATQQAEAARRNADAEERATREAAAVRAEQRAAAAALEEKMTALKAALIEQLQGATTELREEVGAFIEAQRSAFDAEGGLRGMQRALDDCSASIVHSVQSHLQHLSTGAQYFDSCFRILSDVDRTGRAPTLEDALALVWSFVRGNVEANSSIVEAIADLDDRVGNLTQLAGAESMADVVATQQAVLPYAHAGGQNPNGSVTTTTVVRSA